MAGCHLSEGVWRNGSASDSRSEGWEFESLCPQDFRYIPVSGPRIPQTSVNCKNNHYGTCNHDIDKWNNNDLNCNNNDNNDTNNNNNIDTNTSTSTNTPMHTHSNNKTNPNPNPNPNPNTNTNTSTTYY